MKKIALVFSLLMISTLAFSQDFSDANTKIVTQSGIGLGSVLAVVTSWERNKSILWAILHGIFSWFYVIYFAVTRK